MTADTEKRELLPCPWCKAPPVVHEFKTQGWMVECRDSKDDCLVRPSLQRFFHQKSDAEDAWNTLAAPGRAVERYKVPEKVMQAVERMCMPLHESRLRGLTAKLDAQCMATIRDFILPLAASPSPGEASESTKAQEEKQAMYDAIIRFLRWDASEPEDYHAIVDQLKASVGYEERARLSPKEIKYALQPQTSAEKVWKTPITDSVSELPETLRPGTVVVRVRHMRELERKLNALDGWREADPQWEPWTIKVAGGRVDVVNPLGQARIIREKDYQKLLSAFRKSKREEAPLSDHRRGVEKPREQNDG